MKKNIVNRFFILIIIFLLFLGIDYCFADSNYNSSVDSLTQSEEENLSDKEFLDILQRVHFNYMWKGAEPISGLAYERIFEDGDYSVPLCV